MKPKHQTLNEIIHEIRKHRSWVRYGEIGTAYGDNWVRVRADESHGCEINADRFMAHEFKHGPVLGVNTMSYCSSYTWIREQLKRKKEYDLIFIDGDHRKATVQEDMEGSWAILRKGGIMVLHDVHPQTARQASRKRPENLKEAWCGDGWRSFIGFRHDNPMVPSGTLEERWGLGWIQKTTEAIPEWDHLEVPFDYFQEHFLDLLGYNQGMSVLRKQIAQHTIADR